MNRACIILQYVYKPTRCTNFFVIRLYFQYTLYMFRTVSVHLQEHSSNTTARRMVPAFTKYNIQLIKKRMLLKMDWYSPKHVQRVLKIKSNHKKFCATCWLYIYWVWQDTFITRNAIRVLSRFVPGTVRKETKALSKAASIIVNFFRVFSQICRF